MDWPPDTREGAFAVAMVQGMVDLISWVFLAQCLLLLGLALLARNPVVVRRFWCAAKERDVEVAFARPRLPVLGPPLTVQGCSAFDPPAAVTCDRRCVHAERRLPMPPLLGVLR